MAGIIQMFQKAKRLFNRLRYKPWKRELKFFWQRRTRGWDDGDTFSLDHSLSQLIAPRLKRFKEITIDYPVDETEKKWNQKLDKMIAAFEFAGSEARWNAPPEEFKKHQEGINLFAKHFFGLWW